MNRIIGLHGHEGLNQEDRAGSNRVLGAQTKLVILREGSALFRSRGKRVIRFVQDHSWEKDRNLNVNHGYQFLHRRRALIEGRFLFWRQLDLDDLLDALGA